MTEILLKVALNTITLAFTIMSSKLILGGSGCPSFFMNSKMVIFNILAFFLSLIALPNIIINCLNYLSILKVVDGNYNMLTFL